MTDPDRPEITAAVVAFEGESDLRDCLRSLAASTVPFAEVIVVDNASTDGTPEMVEREFPDVVLIRMPSNDGPCTARNEGLRRARHRLVFQVDQDVVVRPDCVARLLEVREERGAPAVVFPRAVDADRPDVVHYDGGSFHYAGVMALRHFYRPIGECADAVEEVDAFISLAALVDRDVLLQVGAYDPAFFILFEDHDLSYRLRACGHRIVAVPDALVDHRAGTAGISFRGGPKYPPRRLFLHSRNRWLVVLKCYRLRTLVLTLPGVLLLGVAYVLFAWTQGALKDYVKAKSSLLRLLPHVRAERRRLAPLRRTRDRELLGAPDLTFSPRIERGKGGSLGERFLTGTLRAYWFLVRPFVG
ncbi:MAG: glycosyltransferase family 2 protein [Planctomycetota bacterium JB042]